MNRPPIAQQISWIYTEDLERSRRFYEGVLGLEAVRDEGGSALVFRTCGEAFIGVCKAFEGRRVEPGGSMVSFVTDRVDQWYEHLRAAGVRLRGPPHRLAAFDIYTLFAQDPDGYVIEFQQFLGPGWPP